MRGTILAVTLLAIFTPAGAQTGKPVDGLPPDIALAATPFGGSGPHVTAPDVAKALGLPSAEADFVRQAIEADGYADVQGLAKDSHGLWHGRALRGHSEIQLIVDKFGSVFTL